MTEEHSHDGRIRRFCSTENVELISFCCRAFTSYVTQKYGGTVSFWTGFDSWWSAHTSFKCGCHFKGNRSLDTLDGHWEGMARPSSPATIIMPGWTQLKCLGWPRDWFFRNLPVICSFNEFCSYLRPLVWTFVYNNEQKGRRIFVHYF